MTKCPLKVAPLAGPCKLKADEAGELLSTVRARFFEVTEQALSYNMGLLTVVQVKSTTLLQAQQRLNRLPQPPARVQSFPDAQLRHSLHVGAECPPRCAS